MAGLIVKSPYIQCGGKQKPGGFMKYIATRDGVEKLPMHGFVHYIGTRPGAERLGKHGLFGDSEMVNLEKTMTEIDGYTGNIWTHIFSLKREDAERLGYNNAKTWRDLLKTHRNEIAEAMNISANNFRWVGAFHNEGEHPHVHMMAWSSNPKEGYLKQDGIRKIKSKLTNNIFKQEMLHLYEQKTHSRDELIKEARKEMGGLIREMKNVAAHCPEVEQLLLELSTQLESVQGKKSYGYLQKPLKSLVDEVVNQVEKIPVVAECYARWQGLQDEVEGYYGGKRYTPKPLSQEKTFHALKNMVIREADGLRFGEITFGDAKIDMVPSEESRYSQSCMLAVTRIFQCMANLFQDNTPTPKSAVDMSVDTKLRRKTNEKKIAQGQKVESHVHEQSI